MISVGVNMLVQFCPDLLSIVIAVFGGKVHIVTWGTCVASGWWSHWDIPSAALLPLHPTKVSLRIMVFSLPFDGKLRAPFFI